MDARDVRAQGVLLRVAKDPGGIRLSWSGGAPDFDVYASAEPQRVVSPARVLATTAASEHHRATPDPDDRVVFLKVGCAGAGCDERCFGGIDEDGDGLADCADPDCAGSPDCVPEADCRNGLDDEGDDLVDCADPDCNACDDGDACTVDACDDAEPDGCREDPVTCDDRDACTNDTCDPDLGCQSVPVACDDGDACNGLETCDPATGACLPGTPVACDDRDACNGLETCDPGTGACLPGTPVSCSDGDECTIDTCDPADGTCSFPPATCDDRDACTTDACDPATGCSFTPAACDDGDACNGAETCDPATGDCLSGLPVTCDDGDACNGVETCDPATGGCLPGTPVTCTDGDACTEDGCDPATGTCSFPPLTCDDRDACTTDGCDPARGCTTTPVRCDDLDACTDDGCDPAAGCTVVPRDCDDGIACTLDGCEPAVGCVHVVDPSAAIARPADLAGRSLAQYPWFTHVAAFNVDAPVELGLDTTRLPDLAGSTCDVYVVTERPDPDWCAAPALIDVRGAPDTRSFAADGTQPNRFPLIGAGQLPATAGTGTGVGLGYDVVLDCNRDGRLDGTDWMDGLGDEAGLYLVHDLTLPGPLGAGTFDEIGPLAPWPGPWLGGDGEGDDVRVYYPAVLDDPGFSGTFPLVMVSHGNGHSFAWYTSLQQHLASYGYIVAAHDNDTANPFADFINEASSSTMYWTDKLIREQSTLGGGVLDGHVDDTRIAWIGHSRGGEGVVRACDRLHDEGFVPQQFAIDDVRLIVSMAPTDFSDGSRSHPHDVAFHLLYGAADGDVSGCPSSLGSPTDVTTSFNIYERGVGEKSSTYIHGSSHAELHDCGVQPDEGDGPDRPGCDSVHLVQQPALLAVMKRHVDAQRSEAARDFLWRQFEDLKPIGAPAAMVVSRELDPGDAAGSRVLDDFQAQPAPGTSSSGGSVAFTVQDVAEDLLDDADNRFDWFLLDPFNGMTRVNAASDSQAGVTFRWDSPSSYALSLDPGSRDVSGMTWLSLRACQITRAPETRSELGDLAFTVELEDGGGRTSRIRIDAFGGGIEEPYQRTGCDGAEAGWQDEFEVIRLRLQDFRNEGSGLDLRDLATVRLLFGGTAGSAEGRIAVDDIELQR